MRSDSGDSCAERASEEEEPRPLLTKDLVEDPCNQDKDSWVHMDETEVVQVPQCIFPRSNGQHSLLLSCDFVRVSKIR